MKEKSEILAPMLIEDLGMRFASNKSSRKVRFGLYKCNCNNEFTVQISSVKSGNTTSCGCSKSLKNIKHGKKNHRLYNVWTGIIDRTTNEKSNVFYKYGGRGITVCDRWKDINNFIEDMYPLYKEGLTIDRIDNDKGYSPENCRWAEKNIQARNTRVLRSHNTSGYRGVSFRKNRNTWQASIRVNNSDVYLGSYKTALEAAQAYDRYVISSNLEHNINGVSI